MLKNSDCRKRSDDSVIHCQDWDPETGEQIILVQQDFEQDCDINFIVNRFLDNGLEIPLADGLVFGDDTARPRYEQAKQLILNAENSFDSLPAKIRKRFDNRPELFLEFMDDSENDEEAIRLGLKDDPSKLRVSAEKLNEDVPPLSSLDINGGTDTKTVV